MKCFLLLSLLCSLLLQVRSRADRNSFYERNLFATELFESIATERRNENVIISPIAIQTALGLAYYGAEGRTAEELRKGLHAHESKESLAMTYEKLIHSYIKSKTELAIANKIYVKDTLPIAPRFREIAQKYFDSDIENINFENEAEVVAKINAWITAHTNGKIENVLDSLDSDTNIALVNAIFFKAKWARPFDDEYTTEREFWQYGKESIKVPTMFAENWYYYADIPELDAKAIELFFENTNLTMWFILPYERDGLAALESKLRSYDINSISDSWEWKSTTVYLPKFKFDFDSDLKPYLKKLGITTMFSDGADFSNLFKDSPVGTRISRLQHKTFIDVNEIGCEAAGASYAVGVPMSLPLDPKTFIADHPFVFVICDKNNVYFTGHIVKF